MDDRALPLAMILQMAANPLTLSNCTSHVQQAMEVLETQLKIYVENNGILPIMPEPSSEVLFTFDRATLCVKKATVIFWGLWKSMTVRMKLPAV
jgi:hypothetical protein